MKYKRIIEIISESEFEDQFIMQKFPSAWWNRSAGFHSKTTFYIPVSEEMAVKEAYNELKEVKRKLKKGE